MSDQAGPAVGHGAVHTAAAPWPAEAFHTLKAGDRVEFEAASAAVLAYQRRHNAVYARFIDQQAATNATGQDAEQSSPYLPVAAYGLVPVVTFPPASAEAVFVSSGTTGATRSQHFVRHLELYRRAVVTHFRLVFGDGPFTMLFHLPSYAPDSSLVAMARMLVRDVGDDASVFFLDDVAPASRAIGTAANRIVLFGAAFGLLGLAESGGLSLPASSLVIETGGMKTRRRETTREALHDALAAGFGVSRRQVYSEYGMCEMLSQCYTRGDTRFVTPPWVSFDVVDPERPWVSLPEGMPGALAVVDLANVYSASAMLTQDQAIRRLEGFEVTGRLAGSAIRGCNFLIADDV